MITSMWQLLPNLHQSTLQHCQAQLESIKVSGLCLDSRELKPGHIFFALPGTQVDGRDFIEGAYKKNPALIVTELSDGTRSEQASYYPKLRRLELPDIGRWVGSIAAAFFGWPSRDLYLVGITGTNGKTTTSFMIASLAQASGINAGVMGTNGYGMLQTLLPQALTTPNPIDVQRQLAELRDQGVQLVAMEVSSHALAQHRVQGCQFRAAIFTNLSRDHLDFHGDFAGYSKAKQLLFQTQDLELAVLNGDDQAVADFLTATKAKDIVVFQQNDVARNMSEISQMHTTIHFNSQTPGLLEFELYGQDIQAHHDLIGEFNNQNLLASLLVLLQFGLSKDVLLKALTKIVMPNGRMQKIQIQTDLAIPCVIVDFAHTPDAIERVLKSLRPLAEQKQGRLKVVFGCGGNRDRGKRSTMAVAVETYAQDIFVTADNPRFEDQAQIFADIKVGFTATDGNRQEPHWCPDRAQAITQAIESATADDYVVILGKGHEQYQDIKGVKYAFDDAVVAKDVLERVFSNTKYQ